MNTINTCKFTHIQVFKILSALCWPNIRIDINGNYYVDWPVDHKCGGITTSAFQFRSKNADTLLVEGFKEMISRVSIDKPLAYNSDMYIWDECIWRKI